MDNLVSVRTNDDGKDHTVLSALDWKRAHTELVVLARTQAGPDMQIGRWLSYARRAATHAYLGYASIAEYARQLFGFTPRQTQERLRVAEALEELPALGRAFEEGKLCWSAVRELTRVATPETEPEWLAAAKGRGAHQVEEMVKGRARGDRPSDPVKSTELRRVLRFELSTATYATVQEALTKIRRDSGGVLSDDEALLLMARHVLGGPTDEGRSSYQIAISMCPSCERAFQHARGESVELSRAEVDAACCDAQHIGEVGAGEVGAGEVGAGEVGAGEVGAGEVGAGVVGAGVVGAKANDTRNVRAEIPACAASALEAVRARPHVGACADEPTTDTTQPDARATNGAHGRSSRATQSVPPRIRRLVLRRARNCCEVPSCRNSIFLDVHHRTLRSEGGTNDPNELVALCGAHHGAIHDGRLRIEGNAATGWTFRHADGTAYGTAPTVEDIDVSVKVFRALRSLGFRQGDARRALDRVTRAMQTHAGTPITTERMLREAVLVLTH